MDNDEWNWRLAFCGVLLMVVRIAIAFIPKKPTTNNTSEKSTAFSIFSSAMTMCGFDHVVRYARFYLIAFYLTIILVEEILFRSWPLLYFGPNTLWAPIFFSALFSLVHQLNYGDMTADWRFVWFVNHWTLGMCFWVFGHYHFLLGYFVHLCWNYTVIPRLLE